MAGRLSPSIDSHEPQQQHGLENCLVLRPTKEEFSVPFCEYVRKVFKKHPDLPMFKVIPPAGWKARNSPFPDLRKVSINVPIRQHVFGTKGAYRCVFVEEKSMSVYDFRKKAEEEAVKVRKGHGGAASTTGKEEKEEGASSGHAVRQHRACCASSHTEVAVPQEEDVQLERAFWSGVTLNPPLYGADTPHSFFDDKLKWGWNLRNLGDMLRDARVADIPGVTTPMTYFGMWRSFFGWHKEDADLYSTNYLHFGAPKMWYCVAPSDKDKFERMAQGLFPELHKACPAFVRHKDILLSPSLLKTYNVPYIMAKQNVGEFMVLNAASYHAGFNCGFNCAEAVNFAMKEWIPVGKEARPCKCTALKDGVRIDMRLFDPKWVDPYASGDEEDGSEDDSDATSDAGSEHSHSEDEGSGSAEAADDSDDAEDEEEEEQEEEDEETPKKKSRSGTRKSGSAKKPAASPGAAKKTTAAAAKASTGGSGKKRGRAADGEAEGAKDSKRRRSSSSEGAEGSAKKVAAAKPKAIPKGKVLPSRAALAHHLSQCALGRSMVSSLTPNLMSRRAMAAQVDEVQGEPLALLAYDRQRNQRVFFLVQRLKRPAALPGHVALRWLKQGPDGLHRPVNGTVWEDLPATLLPVRTQHVAGGVRRASGWRLLDSDASIVSHLLVASKA